MNSSFHLAAKIMISPSNYLKKRARPVPKVGGSVSKFVRTLDQKRPSVPSRHDKPIMGLTTNKSFITTNAIDVILMKPRTMDESPIFFVEREGYGKVPRYLFKVKEDIQREQEMVDEYVKQDRERNKVEPEIEYAPLNESERQELIIKLKQKWGTVNTTYQKMCHRVTIEGGDVKRKEAQEAELDQLEKDIALLSRPGPILVKKV